MNAWGLKVEEHIYFHYGNLVLIYLWKFCVENLLQKIIMFTSQLENRIWINLLPLLPERKSESPFMKNSHYTASLYPE